MSTRTGIEVECKDGCSLSGPDPGAGGNEGKKQKLKIHATGKKHVVKVFRRIGVVISDNPMIWMRP